MLHIAYHVYPCYLKVSCVKGSKGTKDTQRDKNMFCSQMQGTGFFAAKVNVQWFLKHGGKHLSPIVTAHSTTRCIREQLLATCATCLPPACFQLERCINLSLSPENPAWLPQYNKQAKFVFAQRFVSLSLCTNYWLGYGNACASLIINIVNVNIVLLFW